MHKWKHPTLGVFTFDYVGWDREISMPAFRPFRYVWGGSLRSRTKFSLNFSAEDKLDDSCPETPTKRAIQVADRVIANQYLLAKRLLNAVWRDLHGRGPETGMWWHGDLATVHESIESSYGMGKPMPLNVKEDLFDIMSVTSVSIENEVYRYEKPCAIICFDTAIDPEHGLGILTDGTRILGVGYQDAKPYRKSGS